jgi:hypothetical protein
MEFGLTGLTQHNKQAIEFDSRQGQIFSAAIHCDIACSFVHDWV